MSLTLEEYDKRVDELLTKCKQTLLKKRDEYTEKYDPLKNFKDAAKMSQILPEQALWYFCLKHLVSIKDIIFDKGLCSPDVSKALLEEKTGDIINYMILLNLIQDDYDKEYRTCK